MSKQINLFLNLTAIIADTIAGSITAIPNVFLVVLAEVINGQER